MFDEAIDIFVIEASLNQRKILRHRLLHLASVQFFEETDVFDDSVHFITIKCERLFEIAEDPDEVENKSVGLDHLLGFVFVRSIDPRNCLQECVVSHRFVEIHGVKNGRVKTSQKLFGNNENLGKFVEFWELFTDVFFLPPIDVEGLEFR